MNLSASARSSGLGAERCRPRTGGEGAARRSGTAANASIASRASRLFMAVSRPQLAVECAEAAHRFIGVHVFDALAEVDFGKRRDAGPGGLQHALQALGDGTRGMHTHG